MPPADPAEAFPWIQRHRGAARQRKVAFALVQAATCHVHGDQARRACGVHRYRRTVQAHGVGDPPGRHAEIVAQESVGPLQGVGIGCRQYVVAMRQSHEHTGPRAGQRLSG